MLSFIIFTRLKVSFLINLLVCHILELELSVCVIRCTQVVTALSDNNICCILTLSQQTVKFKNFCKISVTVDFVLMFVYTSSHRFTV